MGVAEPGSHPILGALLSRLAPKCSVSLPSGIALGPVSLSAQKGSLLYFGPFTVDLAGHCLLRDGVRVYLQEQPYQILLALLETPGQVVTRESLRLRLWGEETFVDFDQSLNSAVRRLRVALEDSSRQPVYVATVPRVGFRFLAEVRRSGETEVKLLDIGDTMPEISLPLLPLPTESGMAGWPVRLLLMLSVAVGLLCGVLAGTGGARVWAWLHAGGSGAAGEGKTAVDGRGVAVGSAASLPSTAHAEGSAATLAKEPAGSSFGAMPTLSAADHGRVHLPDTGSLLPVTEALGRANGGAEALGSAGLTELTGWYHLQLRTEVDYGLAKEAFRQAIAADPRSPTPLVGLGESEILMALNGYAPAERFRTARQAGERARQMAPDLPEAHAVIGAVDALERWDLPAAEREFHVALALDPHRSLPRLWLAMFVLLPQHRYAEAEQHTRMAIHDAPLSLTAHTNLGWIYASQGRAAAAREQYQFVLNINPNFVPARFHLSQLLRAEGRLDEARRMQPVDPPAPGDVPASSGELPTVGASAGSMAAKSPVARCQQITGDLNGGSTDAMAALRAAVRERCPGFFFFGQNPEFNALHGTPEFARLEQAAFLARR